MYGWRARLGLIIAHSNTTMEPEFNRVAPDGVSIHAARVPVGERSREGFSDKDPLLESAVKLLSDINARAFAYACTTVNMIAGPDGDVAQAKKIIELTGRPGIPTSLALVEALTAIKAKRIVLATPLPPDLQQTVSDYWRDAGFEVLRIGGMDLGGARRAAEPLSSVPISAVGIQTSEVVYNLARSVYEKGADAIVLINANFRSIDVASRIESDFGIPFLSSGIATMWATLQAAGVRQSIDGFGSVLKDQPLLPWYRLPRA